MSIYILAFLIGAVTGLRALAPAAVVSWAAHLGWLHLQGTWLAFLGVAITPYILSVLALGELITDKLPKTPSRKIPMQFGARIVMGALSGAALAASGGVWIAGLVAGIVGAIVGTFAGAELRGRLSLAVGKDLPADSPARTGQVLFAKQCMVCHRLGGAGDAKMGPDLNSPHNPTEYFQPWALKAFIRNPGSIRDWPERKMQGFQKASLSDSDLDAIIAYLTYMAGRRP